MTKRRKKRSKVIKLNDQVWVKSSDVKSHREKKLKEQDGKCAIHKSEIEKPVLDHAHLSYEENHDINPYGEEGRCRGVLESDINMLEGRYLKLFNRSRIQEKYGISFPDLLINMGEYLKMDNSFEKFHYMYMDEFRKKIKYLNKDVLLRKLKIDFDIEPDPKTTKEDLVQIYMQHWVFAVEETF